MAWLVALPYRTETFFLLFALSPPLGGFFFSGIYTKYKPFVSKDKNFIRMLQSKVSAQVCGRSVSFVG